METEIWKDIPGYEGIYRICNIGSKIESYGTRNSGRILRNSSTHGYFIIVLCKKGIVKSHRVHRLKAMAFIPNPDNLPIVNHKDGNKKNNELDNLEWCTHSENALHAHKLGLIVSRFKTNPPNKGKFGVDNPSSKAVYQYSMSGIFIRKWGNAKDVFRTIGIPAQMVNSSCNGGRRYTRGFIFSYTELTLAEVEEKLGLDAGSLIIK